MNKLRVIIYLAHPAQYHFFKNIIQGLRSNGIKVKILLKSKDVLEQLVQESGMDYVNIQKVIRKNNLCSMALATFTRTFRILQIARQYKADLILGTDASVAQSSRCMGIAGITILEDDLEVIARMANITYPFSDSIVVPTVCRVGKWENKKVGYAGYMKLAYLHPNRFAADQNIVKKYIPQDKYCLVRLAQLTAYHDVGIEGLNITLVLTIISLVERLGHKLYISSESNLDERLKPYQLKIDYTDIHHVMSFASLLISDSQSMSVEAAMLGVPSIRFSDFVGRISVLEELEHTYGLTYGITTTQPAGLCRKIEEFLSMSDLREEFQERRRKMLKDKIDVTAFFIWFIENYPQSKKVMKENSDYQYQFR